MHTLDLSPDPSNSKNIILIGGKNGSGKTTIFEAVKLCLFGKYFNGAVNSSKSYENYITSLLNKDAARAGINNFDIQMELEINESFPAYTLELSRGWNPTRETINEYFKIKRDGIPLEIIPEEHWTEYIISLIPPYIANYFFFDGEKVKELAIGTTADQVLHNSIKEIVGLNLYETLSDDLHKLIKKVKYRNIDESETSKILAKKSNEQLRLENRLVEIDKFASNKIEEIEELRQIFVEIETRLRRAAGAYAKERKQNEKSLMGFNEKLGNIEEKIKGLCSDMLPFAIATKLNVTLIKQLGIEKQVKKIESNRAILTTAKRKVLNRIQKNTSLSSIPKNHLDLVKNEIDSIFHQIIKEQGKCLDERILHDLSSSVSDSILTTFADIETDLKAKLESYLKKREEILKDIKRIRNNLKQVPDEEFVKEYIQNMANVQAQIEKLETEIHGSYEGKAEISELIYKLEKEIFKYEESIFCREEDEKKIELSQTIQTVLKEYTEAIISFEISELETNISNMYELLTNKEDMIKEIKIDTRSFCPILFDYSGEKFNKDNISEGEKEIYALSVLWGLSKLSNRKLPIMIDSPLAKLDSTHVKNISTKYFPNAADQLILFSHDLEIDKEVYEIIKPHVNRSYTLSLKSNEKIRTGYFHREFINVN